MSNNFRKTFNIRNGVQVDQDNFIVNSNGLVGIGTSIPREFLDVVGNAQVSGLTTTGTLFAGTATADNLTSTNANITGVITATSISVGGVTFSSIVGYSTEAWIIDYADGSSDPQSGISTTLKVGIGTTQANNKYSLLIGGDPGVGEGITLNGPDGNINSSGIMTATSFYGSGANLTSLNASNISSGTISDSFLPSEITATTFTGNLTGTASTATVASGLRDTPDINVGLLTATNIVGTSLSVGLITSTSSLYLTGTSSRIGIGTASPTTDLQIRRSGNSILSVVSDTDKAKIGLGNSLGIGNSSAEIRFYNKNLELYNYDVGNIDTIIHEGTGAGTTGSFRWIYGQDNSTLLTLTYDGNLGINQSSPTHKLHVGGGASITGSSYFGSNIQVNGTVSANSFNLPSIVNDTNLNNTSGISTFYNINVVGTASTITGLKVTDSLEVSNLNVVGVTSIIQSSTIVVPVLNDSEQSGLSTITGSIIFNSNGKFRGWTGTQWVDFN